MGVVEAGSDWRARFRAPRIERASIAGGRPERGLVVSSRDGGTYQLFAWDVPGGGLTALTARPHGVVRGWLDPAGAFVYYLEDAGGTELGHLVRVPFEGGAPRDLTPAMTPYTLRGLGFDGAGRRLAFNPVNRDGFALYVLDVVPEVGEPRLLHRDSWETWGALLSTRGDLAACWSTARARGVRRHTLLVFDPATAELVAELDDGRDAKVVGVAFAPRAGDSRILASTTRGGYVRPVVWDPRSGSRRDLTLPTIDGDVEPLDWSADGRRVLLCRPAGVQRLLVYDLVSDTLTALEHPPGTYFDPIEGGASFGPGGGIVGVRQTAVAPPEVVELDAGTGHPRRVMLRSGAAPPGRPWRSVTFPSSDGTPVQAWYAVPDGEGPFPTVLEVHGGPHWAVSEAYDPGPQCWLDHGYAWMGVNYRGSTGFGPAFAEQIWGRMGHWELADMVAAREWLVAHGVARPDGVLLYGASYGGYLTLYALGRRPDLWAAGMAALADGDLVACFDEVSDAIRAALTGWMRGTPAERPEAWAASSPITYAADVAAPVLVFQGRNDTRTPAAQMENYERRLRELGKDIEVVWFDGGHQSGGPQLWMRFHERMLQFAHRALAGRRGREASGTS